MWDVARLSGHPNLTLTLAPQHTQHSPNSDPDSQCATVFPYRAEIEGAADQVKASCVHMHMLHARYAHGPPHTAGAAVPRERCISFLDECFFTKTSLLWT